MYDDWAMHIAKGNWLGSDRAFYLDPLYPYLLALQYKIFGHNLLMVRLGQAALGVGTCFLVAVIGRRVGGNTVGLGAALLAALYQPLIFEGGEIEKTALGVFLLTAALTCATGKSTASRFFSGSLLALAALCRGNLLIMGPLGSIYFLLISERNAGAGGVADKGRLRDRLTGKAARDAVAFLAGFLLLLSPVLLRNHYVSGEWILTTSQSGANFYTGNNPENWSGAYNAVSFVRPLPEFEEYDFRVKAEQLTGKKMTAKEVSSFWLHESLAHIGNNPLFASMVFVRKFILFWGDLEFPDGWSLYFIRKYSPALRLSFFTFGWLFPFAVIGSAVSWRRSREAGFLSGFALVYFLTVLVFFVFSRYRLYVVPPLLVFASMGMKWSWERLREQNWRKFVTAALVLLVAAVFSFCGTAAFGYRPEMFVNNYAQLAELYEKKGNYGSAEALLQEALRRQPEAASTLCALGTLRLTVNDPAGAVVYLHRCLEADAEYPSAWNILGAAYDRLGNYEEARRCFETQLQILPGHQQARNNLQRLVLLHFSPGNHK